MPDQEPQYPSPQRIALCDISIERILYLRWSFSVTTAVVQAMLVRLVDDLKPLVALIKNRDTQRNVEVAAGKLVAVLAHPQIVNKYKMN